MRIRHSAAEADALYDIAYQGCGDVWMSSEECYRALGGSCLGHGVEFVLSSRGGPAVGV